MSETPDYPHDPTQEIVVPVQGLKDFLTRLLVKLGAKEEVARATVANAPDQPARAQGAGGRLYFRLAVSEKLTFTLAAI